MEGGLKSMSLFELLNRTGLQVFTCNQGTLAKMACPDGAGRVLCGGTPVHNAIFVMSMKKVMSLINSTLQIKEIEKKNK